MRSLWHTVGMLMSWAWLWEATVGDVVLVLLKLGLAVLALCVLGFILEAVLWPFHRLRDWLEDRWGWHRSPPRSNLWD